MVWNVWILFEFVVPKDFNISISYNFWIKITFINLTNKLTIHKVIVVFPGYIVKDLGYFKLNKRHVSSQGGANNLGGCETQEGDGTPLK